MHFFFSIAQEEISVTESQDLRILKENEVQGGMGVAVDGRAVEAMSFYAGNAKKKIYEK